VCSDATEFLKVTESTFDAALIKFALHHFGDRRPFFELLRKILRPKGRVAIVTMLPDQVGSFRLVEYFPTLRSSMLAAAVAHSEVVDLLEDLGFSSVEVTASRIAVLKWDQDLVDKVRRRFISFLLNVPEPEFTTGLDLLEKSISTDHEDQPVIVEGSIVFAVKPAENTDT
jgi:SAM-dependent methyltransferase